MHLTDRYLEQTVVSRLQSPKLEYYVQDEINRSLAELLTKRGLYQQVEVQLPKLESFSKTNREYDRPPWYTVLDLTKEFRDRPWMPVSRHLSDDDRMAVVAKTARSAGQPIGTPDNELHLKFYLPSVEYHCEKCKKVTFSSSLAGSFADGRDTSFPRPHAQGTQQFYVLIYRCDVCRWFVNVFLVSRTGFKLQLCGRTERIKPLVPGNIPKEFGRIVEDAISAEQEGDTYAGFYHLRTFVEHYMKKCVELSMDVQITGDELSERYKKTLDARLTAEFPSLGPLFSELSVFLHARKGERTDFDRILTAIDDHFAAKTMFGRFKQQSGTAPPAKVN